MKSIQRSLFILKLFFLFCGMFILGAQLGKLHAALRDCTPASASSESASWGLSFQTEGERPVGNASIEELRPYNAYYAEDTDAKKIYLTFDCGWENGYTSSVLDTLKQKKVPAAFFCTLSNIKAEPGRTARMIKEGHIVGNPSTTHPDFSKISREKMAAEIENCDNYLREKFGYSSPYFRFPMGSYSASSLDLVSSLGYKSVFWSVAYADWDVNDTKGKQYAFDTVTSRLHPGAVILLHSVSPDNAAALADIIDWARNQGYEFRSLEQLPN